MFKGREIIAKSWKEIGIDLWTGFFINFFNETFVLPANQAEKLRGILNFSLCVTLHFQ